MRLRYIPRAALMVAFLLPLSLSAALITWDGGGGNNKMTSGTNWSPDQSLTAPVVDLTGHTLVIDDTTSFGGGTSLSVNGTAGQTDRFQFTDLTLDVYAVIFGNGTDGDLLDNFGGVLTFNAGGGLTNASYRARGSTLIINNSGQAVILDGSGSLVGLGATYDTVQFSGNSDFVIGGTKRTAATLEELTVALDSGVTLAWQSSNVIASGEITLVSGIFSLETADAIDDTTSITFNGAGTLALSASDTVGELILQSGTGTLDVGDEAISFASASGSGNLSIVNFTGNGSLVHFSDASGLDSGFSSLAPGSSLALSNVTLNGGTAYLTKLSGTEGVIGTVAQDGFVVMGYVPGYRILGTPLSHYRYLTHAIYHGFAPDPNNPGALLESWENGSWPLLQTYKDQLDAIRATYPQIKLIMGLAGSSSGYGPATANATVRASFIQNLLDYCLVNSFDGVSFDWEFPDGGGNGPEQQQYSALLVETAAAFAAYGLEVSVADATWGYYLTQAAYDAVDYVNYMGYDFNHTRDGHHAAYDDTTGGLMALLTKGASREKLVYGVPFFAVSYEVAGRQTYPYNYLQGTYGPLDPASDELINAEDDFTYNGIDTIAAKSSYALDNNFAGIMIWELGQDTWTAGDQSLLINGIAPAKEASVTHDPYTILIYEDFEGPTYAFTSGGPDAFIPVTERKVSGTQSALIQDNSDKRSAIDVTVDLAGYHEVVFDFFFSGKGIDWLEDFMVEVNTGGNNWSIIAVFEQGIPNTNGFANGVWNNAVVGIDDSFVGFSNGMKFRIRCDASADDDQIFIDDVTIRAR